MIHELSSHVCLSGQFPYFPVSRRNTTATKILTYFSANGYKPVFFDCLGGESQFWSFTEDHTITAYGGKTCLDVKDGAGVALQAWECFPGNDNQKWWLYYNSTIGWLNHNRCLERVPGDPITVIIKDCSECVEASHVCLITDSRNPAMIFKARFCSSFLCCERLTVGVLLEWVYSMVDG